MTTRPQQLAVVVTCLLAAMTNAGSVTTFALAAFLLPAVVVVALLGSSLAARRMSGTALILGGLLALGWSELVNVWSGTADGPAARATFVAAGCTLVAVVVAQSRSPALFLVAVAGSVCSALLLGAGGEVRIVAVAAAVAAALTLGSIERSRRNWAARSRRGPALVLLSLLAGVAAAGVVLVQAQRDPRQPEAIGSGLAYPGIKPPWTDPLGSVAKSLGTPPPQVAQPHSHMTRPNPHLRQPKSHATKPNLHATQPNFSRPHSPHQPPASGSGAPRPQSVSHRTHASQPSRWWLYVLAAIVLLMGTLTARLLAVRLRWLRLRRALAAGAIAQQITGAWAWTRLRLEACRLPLAAAVSPDLVVAGGAGTALPAEVFAPLQALARRTTTAAFANEPSLSAAEVIAAWTAADQAAASARELLARPARVRLAFRGPAAGARAR